MLLLKNWKMPLTLLILLSALWGACNKDDFGAEGPTVSVTFAGQVTDENNQPLPGAAVSAGDETALTDQNGVFRLKAVRLPARNAILRINLPGYFDFSRAYFVENMALQTVSIQLLKKQMIHSFMATQSTTASVGAAKLNFPANSVAKADGSAYTGLVSVYARYLDPSDPDLNRHMPGDLRGINTGGDEQTLATFGMIGVELATPGGDPLNIAAGKEVELVMPIPSEKLTAAPSEIPLWHYDTENARWIEEGSAQKAGNQYVGKVKHFSFWNCDAGFPIVNLEGRVLLDGSGQPLTGATIRLTIQSTGWQAYGTTDADGRFGGAIPLNAALLLEVVVWTPCTQAGVYSQTIGPFSSNATLPDISVTVPNATTLSVSGRLVDCNQQPVTNGYVFLTSPSMNELVITNADGTFNRSLAWCSAGGLVEVKAYDLDAKKESDPLQYSNPANPLNTGDIAVCNAAAEYVEITLGTETFEFLGPFEGLTSGGTSTHIFGGGPNSSSIYFGFQNNGQTGTFPVDYLTIYPAADSLGIINLTTQVTSFGAPGQLMTGTLSGTVQPTQGPSKTVSGTYKVIRDN